MSETVAVLHSCGHLVIFLLWPASARVTYFSHLRTGTNPSAIHSICRCGVTSTGFVLLSAHTLCQTAEFELSYEHFKSTISIEL